ncbi:hypothetical protein [Rhizobium sp. L1K21]|uniref:hypothetical protein n=1 Tax=Rhizobium sp. L1K21 TaxID=2954933 RepID=UPI002093034F|nr:hypothetical protein [Rhizobium sp. L1K21]MCO6187076.1 hypothetical protein [Rhizobium sp. L1K21]
MGRFWIGFLKIVLASLIAGTALSFVGLTPKSLIGFFGLTPEELVMHLQDFGIWAAPRIVLGAMFVVPLWLVAHIFMPPRGQ